MRLRRRTFVCLASVVAIVGSVAAANDGDVVKLPKDKIPQAKRPDKVAFDQTPLRVKVLVYEFNPWIPGAVHSPNDPQAQPKRLGEVCGWNDSCKLAQGYLDDMSKASGGYLQYEIVEWNVVDSFQRKVDGFSYTPESYMKARQEKNWRQPDGVDYAYEIKKHDMAKRIDAGEADEVWWFGLPYFGYYESIMVGPEAYWINAPPMTDFKCKRRFAIMGFNSERGVAEMIHDVGHRLESGMSYYYYDNGLGGWRKGKLDTNWARFAACDKKDGQGNGGAGHCHYPPNAERDYDYANPREVECTADDWMNYPNLTGKKTTVSCESWGGPDYHRNFQVWYFSRLPKAPGVNDDGLENNWWKYVYNFNAYDKSGKLKPSAKPIKDAEVEKQGAVRPS